MQTTLGEIGSYLNGRAFKKSEWSTSGRPIIRIQDLTGSNRNPNHFEGEVADRHVVEPGDLLISWSATLGVYIWDGPEAVLNQHIFKVESAIDPGLHYHIVRERIGELQRRSHGSGMVHVTKGSFEETPVVLPRSPEAQRELAALLDRCDAVRESSLDHLEAAQTVLGGVRQSVLAAACSGRLTASWRQKNSEVQAEEPVPQLRRKGKKAPPLSLPLPTAPSSYVTTSLRDVALSIDYGTSEKLSGTAEGGIPVLRMGNIQAGLLDLDDLKYCADPANVDSLMLTEGDLLFNRTNSPELVGKSAVFRSPLPMSFASYLIRVRLNPQYADCDYVNYWLNSAWGRAWAHQVRTDGVSQSNINGTKLGDMPLLLPPVEEQREIVRRAKGLLSLSASLAQKAQTASSAIRKSDQALLAKVFGAGQETLDGA